MGQTMTTTGHSRPPLRYLPPPPGWKEPTDLTTTSLDDARTTVQRSGCREQRAVALARWTELSLEAEQPATDLASAFSAYCNAPAGTEAEAAALEAWHKFSSALVDQVTDKLQAVALLRQILTPLEETARARLTSWLAEQLYHR